jgi:hypothetical protein
MGCGAGPVMWPSRKIDPTQVHEGALAPDGETLAVGGGGGGGGGPQPQQQQQQQQRLRAFRRRAARRGGRTTPVATE